MSGQEPYTEVTGNIVVHHSGKKPPEWTEPLPTLDQLPARPHAPFLAA